MKWLWTAVISTAVLSPAWSRQQAPAKPGASEKSAVEPSPQLEGTDLVAELNHGIKVKKARVGDLVKASLTQDVVLHGRIAVPRGSKLIGHVTETKILTRDAQESRLGVIFDKVIFKTGQEVSFKAVVRALAPPVRLNVLDRADQMYTAGAGGMMGTTRSPSPLSPGATGRTGPANNTVGMGPADSSRTKQSAPSGPASSGGNPDPKGDLLSGGSRGVFGLPGLQLGAESGSELGAIISSTSRNVKLDDRTQIVIQVRAVAR